MQNYSYISVFFFSSAFFTENNRHDWDFAVTLVTEPQLVY